LKRLIEKANDREECARWLFVLNVTALDVSSARSVTEERDTATFNVMTVPGQEGCCARNAQALAQCRTSLNQGFPVALPQAASQSAVGAQASAKELPCKPLSSWSLFWGSRAQLRGCGLVFANTCSYQDLTDVFVLRNNKPDPATAFGELI